RVARQHFPIPSPYGTVQCHHGAEKIEGQSRAMVTLLDVKSLFYSGVYKIQREELTRGDGQSEIKRKRWREREEG
ncbi:hypothetical protein ElyMa_000197200, partial [Elysia marginata]